MDSAMEPDMESAMEPDMDSAMEPDMDLISKQFKGLQFLRTATITIGEGNKKT